LRPSPLTVVSWLFQPHSDATLIATMSTGVSLVDPAVHNTAPRPAQAGPSALSLTRAETAGAKLPRFTPLDEWDLRKHVLALNRFPGTCILRNNKRNDKGKGTCSCSDDQIHRDLFDMNCQIVRPSYKDDKDIPEVQVCWNSVNLFEDKLPRDLTGSKNRIRFRDLKTVGEANKVLFKGTYWFARTMRSKNPMQKHGRTGVGILRLLANLSSYTGKEHIGQLCAMKLHHGAVNKLRNILATVDGVIMSLVLAFPDRDYYQSWERTDQIANCLISLLVPDYFRENDRSGRDSAFEKLKRLRKAIKCRAFNPVGDLSTIDVPREMSFIEVALNYLGDRKRPIDIYRASLLCQTRASGVPPKSVYFKTFLKIKSLLQEEEDPSVYERVAGYIRPAVERIHVKVLDRLGSESNSERFWNNCLEKAKISLSDSGEFFTNSESGGKLEAARLILSSGRKINRLNLFDGSVIGELDPKKDPVGECLFHWACGEFRDRNSCYDRNVMSVRISLVAELGKYRAVTVSHLAHAMLLHVLSHVLLEYLKAVPSSESGVGAANHAWNFFKRLSHKNPNANFIFGDKDVYLFSTDWEQATDYTNQSISQAMMNCLCVTLGIPTWYRQTAMFALCAPRQVEFIDEDSKTLECFFTQRGELMGDPVVKVILHYHHLVARESAIMQMEVIRRDNNKRFVKGTNPKAHQAG